MPDYLTQFGETLKVQILESNFTIKEEDRGKTFLVNSAVIVSLRPGLKAGLQARFIIASGGELSFSAGAGVSVISSENLSNYSVPGTIIGLFGYSSQAYLHGVIVGEGSQESLIYPVTDLTTPITAGSSIYRFEIPYNLKLLDVKALVQGAATTGTFTIDINKEGNSIFSTVITIDATKFRSSTAAVPPVISNPLLSEGDILEVDIDNGADGTAFGLSLTLICTKR